MVVVTGEWKCESKAERSCKSEERVENCTLKVLKMSGKLMAIGCWFPPKFPNSGTLSVCYCWLPLEVEGQSLIDAVDSTEKYLNADSSLIY